MKISKNLQLLLSAFVAAIINGALSEPEDIALALDELSDAAWSEAEQLYPPSVTLEP